MSRLDPSVVPLDKGLNLQTAKILAPAGSALSSLNYEQVDFQGQKRIDGFVRYDGNTSPALDQLYFLDEQLFTDGLVTRGDEDLVLVGGSILGRALADTVSTFTVVAVYNFKLLETLPYLTLQDIYPADPDTQLDALLSASDELREKILPLPGAVSGLHWFNANLYAVSDLRALAVQMDTVGVDVPANSVVTFDAVESETRLLHSYQSAGLHYIFVEAMDLDADLDGVGVYFDTGFGYSYSGTVVNSFPDLILEQYPASIFKARTEKQVLEEDGSYTYPTSGWEFKHLGWEVLFKDGNIPFGGFTAVNQNRQGVGVQGPTSIAGNNGRPLNLLQKVDITDQVAQVNGWKTSSTPNSYNLDPLALAESDSTYIYADAFVTWDNTTAQIATPDISPALLAERPANSNVIVEV